MKISGYAEPAIRPELDPTFVPAVRWNDAYRRLVRADAGARPVRIALRRVDGFVALHEDRILRRGHEAEAATTTYLERLLKFLLWQKGGSRILIAGADEIVPVLSARFSPSGTRTFDAEIFGRLFRAPFSIERAALDDMPTPREEMVSMGGHLDGCRIGFDLGGSDRKCAAVIDGKVVHSEEIPWSPYFQTDPNYHLEGIHDSIARAAAHLPRVDAIGGSAAGVYVANEVRAASLFRGVSPDDFERTIRRVFFTLQARWNNVPLEVANDGEVTALAGSLWLKESPVLGISMGTSQAAGYVTPAGSLTSWINELAFAPVDLRAEGPRDEWSGDAGCGVQYFSQQAVSRLSGSAGFPFPAEMPDPERLVAVQEAFRSGDPRATRIFGTVGDYLGYAIAHYADFYELGNVLLVGRVVSGGAGELVRARALQVLQGAFPALHEKVRITLPSEQFKRHGQAIAAASLPRLSREGRESSVAAVDSR